VGSGCVGAGAWARGRVRGCNVSGAERTGACVHAPGCVGARCMGAAGCLGVHGGVPGCMGGCVGAECLYAQGRVHEAGCMGAGCSSCGTGMHGAGCLQGAQGWVGAVGASRPSSLLRSPGAGVRRGGCMRGWGSLTLPVPLAAAGHEGQGAEAVLQGDRAGQGDAARRGLRCLPLGRAAQPALHRAHREHVGVLGQQHGGQGQVVLPPRGDQAGQAAERRQGEGWARGGQLAGGVGGR